MTYLALVQDDDWALSRSDFVRALRSDWPSAAIDEPTSVRHDPARDVVWSSGSGSDRIEGSAHESGQCIYLDGQTSAVAEFVSWYRRLVPADRTVILCDDTYSFDAVVNYGVGAGDVIALFP